MEGNNTRKKLRLSRTTLTTISGGPGHRTTNRCTANHWQTCGTVCSCETCIQTCTCPPGSEDGCMPSDRRLKLEIELIGDALAAIDRLAL